MRVFFALFLLPLVAAAAEPPMTALALAPDGKSVVIGSQAGVQVRTWPDLKLDRTIATDLANVHDVAFSPDGMWLAIAGGAPAEKGTVELVKWPDGNGRFRVSPHKDVVHAVTWSADSTMLATASADRMVRILDANTGKSKIDLDGHSRGVLAVAFLPGNAQIVTAGADETLRLWDVRTGKLERNLSNHTRPVNGLAVRPTKEKDAPSMLVSIADDRTVRFWQPTLGRMMRFARLPSEPRAVAWGSDGTVVVVACKDGRVRVIDPETVEIRAEIAGSDGIAYAMAIAGDGTMLLGGRDGQLKRLKYVEAGR